MSGRPTSTLGFERIANPYLDPHLTQEAFVDRLLASSPPFPDYYRRMKQLNADGPAILGGLPGQTAIPVAAFHAWVQRAAVVDLRDQLSFGAGQIPGAYGVGASGNVSQWASWMVPYDQPILLVASDPAAVPEAVRSLIRVGLDDVRGYLDGGMSAWVEAGHELAEIPQITALELHQRLADGEAIDVVDVRTDSEFDEGHVAGSRHIMGGYLPKHLAELSTDEPLAMICRTGNRSTMAASVLARAGFRNVVNVTGGMRGWQGAGLPVERG
jgi:hydroxyacylglutathione hydrolase